MRTKIPPQLKEPLVRLKEATEAVKLIERRKKDTYKRLSAYSKKLLDKEHKEAVEHQMDIIDEIVTITIQTNESKSPT